LVKLKEMVAPAKRVQSAKKVFSAAKDAGVIEKLKPSSNGSDDEGQEGVGDGRRMPIQQSVDVAVPVETAWKLWNKYEDYPKFMHRVESAEKTDPKHVQFTGKIWGIRRNWEAKITEKRTHEAVAWTSEDSLDIAPHGPLEKIGRGMRFTKRAVRADLHRFKAYAEMNDA
jgi:uncharacterized membrane protein